MNPTPPHPSPSRSLDPSTPKDLLDWAESIICNGVPMAHCTQVEWDDFVKRWRDAKHAMFPDGHPAQAAGAQRIGASESQHEAGHVPDAPPAADWAKAAAEEIIRSYAAPLAGHGSASTMIPAIILRHVPASLATARDGLFCARWNFANRGGEIWVCENGHEKSSPCNYREVSSTEVIRIIDRLRSAVLAAATATGDKERLSALRAIVKGDGCLVFLDGRNEYGTHILPGNLGGVDWDELAAIEVRDGDSDFVEKVFKEAESLGFKEGDYVWLDWRHDAGQMGEEGMWEIRPYWEYNGVNKAVSLAIASARAQRDGGEGET